MSCSYLNMFIALKGEMFRQRSKNNLPTTKMDSFLKHKFVTWAQNV